MSFLCPPLLDKNKCEAGTIKDGVPQGEMSPQAFREWLLESNTSTSLDVGRISRRNVSNRRKAFSVLVLLAAPIFLTSINHLVLYYYPPFASTKVEVTVACI